MAASKPHAFLKVWLYHDETKNADLSKGKRYAHGILAAPETLVLEWPYEELPLVQVKPTPIKLEPIRELFAGVQKIREDIGYDGKLHAMAMKGKQWGKHEDCGSKVLALVCDFLRHKGSGGKLPAPFFRFGALFFPPKTPHLKNYYSGDSTEKVLQYLETLMRMAIKGVLHYGYTGLEHVFSRVEVEIQGLILDGDEHLKRPIDQERVIDRLQGELRSGLTIAPDFKIRAVDSHPKGHHHGSQNYIDSELLQATDLLLGAVRFVADGSYHGLCPPKSPPPDLHAKLASRPEKMAWVYRSVCKLLEKSAKRRTKNPKAWMNSGHYRSFSLSQAELNGSEWQFQEVEWKLDVSGQVLLPLFPNG